MQIEVQVRPVGVHMGNQMPQTCWGTGITIYTSSKSGCGTGSRSSNCPDLGKQHAQSNLQSATVAI